VNLGNDELRQKLDDAKLTLLPLPQLLGRLGLSPHAKKSARCPFPDHEDKHPSFSVFQGEDGYWHYKCFSKCGEGDELTFVMRWKGLSMTQAMNLYLDMAGFPPSSPPKSHECPASLTSHESPMYPVSPVSNGQGPGEALKALAVRNACTQRNTARERRWKLVRDLRAVEKGICRSLSTDDLMQAFNEWYCLSEPYLDPAKTCEDYLAMFLAELTKVRVPTGEGHPLNEALECVRTLSDHELPDIPLMPDVPAPWRRLAALHRELSRLSPNKDKTYFLSYRDAAKVYDGLSHQAAHTITFALARLRVVKIVRNGQARLNGGKAAEFRYLLPTAIEPF
jgi:CHC2 zinc finger